MYREYDIQLNTAEYSTPISTTCGLKLLRTRSIIIIDQLSCYA